MEYRENDRIIREPSKLILCAYESISDGLPVQNSD